MSPELQDGDYVLVLNKSVLKPKEGDTILFEHDFHGKLLKKWSRKTETGVFVDGVQKHSIDSHTLGTIPMKDIFGKVIYSFSA